MSQLESPRERATITVRIDSDLKEQYRDEVDSMSDDLRDHIRSVVESEAGGRQQIFEDKVLNDGYRALRDAAHTHDPNGRRIDVSTATAAAAESTKVPSKAIRQRVFKPLEELGYLRPAWGSVIVRAPEEV